jgi:hypothetical protein
MKFQERFALKFARVFLGKFCKMQKAIQGSNKLNQKN